jgi:hypothetical protein
MQFRQSAFIVAWLCAACCLPVFAQPAVPQWLQNANPGDYVLLKQELPAGFSILGDIQADAEARGFGFTDAQGKTTQQQGFILSVHEQIEAKNKDEAGIVTVFVLVCGSPDRAIALAREHYGDYGMDPDWMVKGTDLGAPAIAPKGGSVKGPGKAIVRLRDMVALFSWNGAVNEFADQKTWQIARLWLKKMGGSTPDLRVTRHDVFLKYWEARTPNDHEIAADQQSVIAWILNTSADVEARDVRVTFSVKLAGDKDYRPIGRPVAVGNISPGRWAQAKAVWDLNGKNVENADLMVVAASPGVKDTDPTDNEAHLTCSIYYAHSGKTPYRWVEDSYSFGNYGFEDREGQEMVEGILATAIGQLYTDPQAATIMTRLIFPQTYTRFMGYLQSSMKEGAGGHCYGLCATAGLYFLDASLRPGGGRTCDLTQDAASPNVNIYQRAQMVPLAMALLSGDEYFERNWGSLKCLATVRDRLKTDRKPVILSIGGSEQVQEQVIVNGVAQNQPVNRWWGHALLAYKLIEVEGEVSAVCVYDPNIAPKGQWNGQEPATALHVRPGTGGWGVTSNMTPWYGGLSHVAAREVTREVPLTEANALVAAIKAKLAEMRSWFDKAHKIMAVLRCPADALFTDPQGRRVGMLNGKPVNEVPGAEIRSQGEVEIYVLPSNVPFTMQLTGTAAGEANFDLLRSKPGALEVTVFGKLPVTAGGRFQGTVASGGVLARLTGPDGRSYAPTLVGTLQGAKVAWQGGVPVGPTGGPSTNTGQSVEVTICERVVDGQPQNIADRFAAPKSVAALVRYKQLPANSTVAWKWVLNGRTEAELTKTLSGSGWHMHGLKSDTAIIPGTYTLVVTVNGKEAARRSVVVTGPGGGTTGGTTGGTGGTSPLAGSVELIICETAPNGQPQSIATEFVAPKSVTALVKYTKLPAGTTIQFVWTRDGQPRAELTKAKEGTGWQTHSLTADTALTPGRYHLSLLVNGRSVAERDLLVRAAGSGTATTPTTTAPTVLATFALKGPSWVGTLAKQYDRNRFGAKLGVTWTKPGAVLDTVGINAAPVGSFAVMVDGTGKMHLQVYAPNHSSPHKQSNGWHVLPSPLLVKAGQYSEVMLTIEPPAWGFCVSVGGQKQTVTLTLRVPASGDPIYVGDFPGDNNWPASLNPHRGITGTVKVLNIIGRTE